MPCRSTAALAAGLLSLTTSALALPAKPVIVTAVGLDQVYADPSPTLPSVTGTPIQDNQPFSLDLSLFNVNRALHAVLYLEYNLWDGGLPSYPFIQLSLNGQYVSHILPNEPYFGGPSDTEGPQQLTLDVSRYIQPGNNLISFSPASKPVGDVWLLERVAVMYNIPGLPAVDAPIDEPSTIMLVLLGAAALCGVRWPRLAAP